MRVVVLADLPRTRETVLLRLLGSGRLLRAALAELAALADDAWERSIATPLLVHFRLAIREPATNEEDDVSAEIRAWFEDYERKLRAEERNEGLNEGRNEGRKEGERNLLLRQLRARFGELPAAAVARIDAAEIAEIERWGERVLAAQTLAEVLDEPS
jgi:flagellar biosynthesis/type III secretory pathway protein FliH